MVFVLLWQFGLHCSVAWKGQMLLEHASVGFLHWQWQDVAMAIPTKEANALWSYVILWQPAAVSREGLPPHESRSRKILPSLSLGQERRHAFGPMAPQCPHFHFCFMIDTIMAPDFLPTFLCYSSSFKLLEAVSSRLRLEQAWPLGRTVLWRVVSG